MRDIRAGNERNQEYADTLEQASIDEAFLDCTTRIKNESPETYATKIKKDN